MKKYKEYLPIVIAGIILLAILITPIMFALTGVKEVREDIALRGRSGGTGPTTGSLVEYTSGSYDAYQLITGPMYLERVVIGESLSGSGMILSNATANNLDAIKILQLIAPPVGSIDIGAYLDMGLMITTSPDFDATFIYSPF